jgi:hypothetical protein
MGLDASQLLGSPQLAGVKVMPKGGAWSVAAGMGGTVGVGGLLGGAISAAAGGSAEKRQAKKAAQTPKIGRAAYLAVTTDEVALIGVKGAITSKLDEPIERVPRGEVTRAELGPGLAPSLTVTFRGGETWRFEVARVVKKDAQAVVDALAG